MSSGQRQGYASELAGLWSDLSRTLRRLEEIAADPVPAFDEDDGAEELARLRYSLHIAGERAYGIEPPPGAEGAHGELAAALAGARDATAEVADAVDAGGAAATAFLVHEWRGALFRVRLARLRMSGGARARGGGSGEISSVTAPLVAFALTICGATVFVAGATLSAWPLWAAGMLAVVGGLLAYRP